MITYIHDNTMTIHSVKRQSGAVLMVALVLMVILTMAGISALDSTKLETRMAANTKEYNAAFQNAEVGIATALKAYKAENISKLPNERRFTDGDSVSLERGSVKYAVMMAGIKDASQNMGGGSMGAKYFLIRSDGKSESGVPVTIYAGMFVNTPSDSGQLNEVGTGGGSDATTGGTNGGDSGTDNQGSGDGTGNTSGTGDSGSGSGTGDSGSGGGTGDSGSTGDAGSTDGTGDAGSTGDTGSTGGTGDTGSTSGTSDSGGTSGTSDSGSTGGTSDSGSASGTGDSSSTGGSGDAGSSGNP